MKIEEVEALEELRWNTESSIHIYKIADQAIAALRAEAWHPIEKAEELRAKLIELGVKEFDYFIVEFNADFLALMQYYQGHLRHSNGAAFQYESELPATSIRFINSPEGA